MRGRVAVSRQPSAFSPPRLRRRFAPIAAPPRPLWVPRRGVLLPQLANGKFILGETGKFLHHGTAGIFDTCEQCCGCPASVDLTLAGIDGNGNMSCLFSGGGLWTNWFLSGIDGTYNIAKTGETSGAPDEWCIYQVVIASGGGEVIRRRYSDNTCATLADETDMGYALTVLLYKESGLIRAIWVSPSQSSTFNSQSGGINSVHAYPGVALDVAHSNQNAATSICSVGTGLVSIP